MPEVEIPDPHEAHEKAADPFTKKIALCVAIYAVILAVAGAGGKHAGKEMISEQILASNSWAQYQAKVVREAIYTSDLEKYQFERGKGGLTPEAEAQLAKSTGRVQQKIEQYKTEKEEIRTEAEGTAGVCAARSCRVARSSRPVRMPGSTGSSGRLRRRGADGRARR